MDTDAAIHVANAVYKIVCLLVGLGFGWMGYKLFLHGRRGTAAESLEVGFGRWTLKMGRSTPGAFFAICGVLIAGGTILKGLEYEYKNKTASSQSTNAVDQLPTTPPFSKPIPKPGSDPGSKQAATPTQGSK